VGRGTHGDSAGPLWARPIRGSVLTYGRAPVKAAP
jgi:hypothetical protein